MFLNDSEKFFRFARLLAVGFIAVCAFILMPTKANAQWAGQGSDMWMGSVKASLFKLHANNCSGTEKFVQVRTVGGVARGFCIDASENAAGGLEFEDARETCLAAGKRLPEVTEYKFACQAGISGLNNMTNNWEWASNFPQHVSDSPNGVIAALAGNSGCTYVAYDYVGIVTGTSASQPFRCVR